MPVCCLIGCSVGGRVRVRWLLLYTLLRNPALIMMRKRQTLTQNDNQDPLLLARTITSQAQQANELVNNKTPETEPRQLDIWKNFSFWNWFLESRAVSGCLSVWRQTACFKTEDCVWNFEVLHCICCCTTDKRDFCLFDTKNQNDWLICMSNFFD